MISVGQPRHTPRGDTTAPAPGADRLTFTGLLVGIYLAVYLCQIDLYIRRQGWVLVPAIYFLLATQAVMALAIWYLNADQIGRILKASSGAILAFGGLAHKPWRVAGAEEALAGASTNAASANAAADAVLAGARGFGHNDFKLALLRRTLRVVLTEA